MKPEALTAKIAERLPSTGDRPAHYRLSTATWKIILGESLAGATVTELCVKWRVSVNGIRARITRHGATKRDHGDQMAVAQAEAWAAAAWSSPSGRTRKGRTRPLRPVRTPATSRQRAFLFAFCSRRA